MKLKSSHVVGFKVGEVEMWRCGLYMCMCVCVLQRSWFTELVLFFFHSENFSEIKKYNRTLVYFTIWVDKKRILSCYKYVHPDQVDFAKILLRSTILTKFEHEEYFERLHSRITTPRGIDLDGFILFNKFLNNLDDFVVAVNMTKMSPGDELDQKFFRRAVAGITQCFFIRKSSVRKYFLENSESIIF